MTHNLFKITLVPNTKLKNALNFKSVLETYNQNFSGDFSVDRKMTLRVIKTTTYFNKIYDIFFTILTWAFELVKKVSVLYLLRLSGTSC